MTPSNADSVCRWCDEPIDLQESGEWGHRTIGGGMRFWCRKDMRDRWRHVEPRAVQIDRSGADNG